MNKDRIASIVAKVFVVLAFAAVFQYVKEAYSVLVLLIIGIPGMLAVGFQSLSGTKSPTKLWVRVLILVVYTIAVFGYAYYKNWLNISD